MDGAPLLGGACCDDSWQLASHSSSRWNWMAKAESAECLHNGMLSVQLWWRVTTNPEYLMSLQSRRATWKLLPLIIGSSFVVMYMSKGAFTVAAFDASFYIIWWVIA